MMFGSSMTPSESAHSVQRAGEWQAAREFPGLLAPKTSAHNLHGTGFIQKSDLDAGRFNPAQTFGFRRACPIEMGAWAFIDTAMCFSVGTSPWP